ncbi:MAG: CRISPR-associated protein Cas4 [Candidatus Desulforudis sp.]|nr:CRISPR-associated protein Cas4 [Desulforudis sp.]
MMLKVSDVKQFLYCPRVVYFTYVMPVPRKVTRKMEYGKEEHLDIERLERRRKLRSYDLSGGERRYRTKLRSERLGVEGVLDMHIVCNSGCFPVEFKNTSRRPGLHHKYQLVSYAMLLEDQYGKPVRQGYLYLTPGKRIYGVEITPNARTFVRRTLDKIRMMIARESFPPAPRRPARCFECEYRNYCADVV